MGSDLGSVPLVKESVGSVESGMSEGGRLSVSMYARAYACKHVRAHVRGHCGVQLPSLEWMGRNGVVDMNRGADMGGMVGRGGGPEQARQCEHVLPRRSTRKMAS